MANELDEACKKTGLKGKEMKDWNLLHELKPVALQVLHELVSLVHDHVKVSDNSQPVQSTPIKDSAGRVKGEDNKIVTATLFRLEDDPVAKILWALEPSTLQHVFLAMAVSLYFYNCSFRSAMARLVLKGVIINNFVGHVV